MTFDTHKPMFFTAKSIAVFGLGFAFCVLPLFAAGSDVGRKYPPEKTIWTDSLTKVTLTVLTQSAFNDSKPYQTHESMDG